jgi:hypothetical protein
VKNRLRLHNFLLKNGYELNSKKITVYSNPDKYFYKDGILIKFFSDRTIIIKDIYFNRKYNFNKSDSNYIISNFIKNIEKTSEKILA